MDTKPQSAFVLLSLVAASVAAPSVAVADVDRRAAPPNTTVESATVPSAASVATTSSPHELDEATILSYLDALDSVDASPALTLASPRSAAWRYAEHQVAVEEASREYGLGATTSVVTPLGGRRFQLCSEEISDSCPVFGDFTTDSAGLIRSFTVDGVDITSRIGDPSDPLKFGDAMVRVRSSYRSVRSDALVVTLEVEASSDLVLVATPRYTDFAGNEVEIVDALIPPILPAGSSSTITLVYPAVDPGGRLLLELSPAAGGEGTNIDVDVPALSTGAELAVPGGAATVTTTTSQPNDSEVPPALPEAATELIIALGPTLGGALEPSGEGFIAPEATCLDAVIESLDPNLREAVDALIDDPAAFYSLPDDEAEGVVLAYLECIDPASLLNLVSATVTRAVDDLPCIVDGWAELITPERIASSMAYGNGLDDLPGDVVDAMTLTAAVCVPDGQWWIDDEAQALEHRGFDAETASCVAIAIVDELGIGPIIRRRVLTVPFYPVPSAELEHVDLPGRCNVGVGGPSDLGPPGTCLSGFGQAATTEQAACDQPHNAEVVTATDLASEFPTWPGYQFLRETVATRCGADVEVLAGDVSGYGAGWDFPNRLAWEQGDRVLTCTLVRPGYSSWTGPSGLVPVTPTTTTFAATTTVPAAPTTVSPTSVPTLAVGDLEFDVPAVEGFTYNLIPPAEIPWAQLDLPEDTDGFGFGVKAAGAPVGSLFVVDGSDFQTYVDHLFDDPTAIERDPATPGTPAATASEARTVWRSFGGTPVASATLTDSGVGQWVWGHDGLTWIATGSLTMEELISGVIAQQQATTPSDPHDYSQLAGHLFDRWLQEVPGYLFVDQPVAVALEQMPNTLAGDCAERLYLGHVAPLDDPDPLPMEPDDLAVVAATIAGGCAEVGFFDDLDGALDAMALRDDVISGVAVRRNDTNIVVVDGEDVIHISSSEPATLVEMEPFINQLITRQREPEVVDFNTLTEGTCLFRGQQRSDDPEDRPVHEVDCATPHQGEVFHVLDLESPPQAPYPGDGPVSTLSDQLCVDAFAEYVGIDFDSSRLNFLYFYPSADTWSTGDRRVICIAYGSDPEELIRGSVAQTAQ